MLNDPAVDSQMNLRSSATELFRLTGRDQCDRFFRCPHAAVRSRSASGFRTPQPHGTHFAPCVNDW